MAFGKSVIRAAGHRSQEVSMSRLRIGLRGLCLSALVCAALQAQDYVEVVDDPFAGLTAAVPKNSHQLTYGEAKALIEATLQQKYTPSPKFVDDPNFYCLIHTLVWRQPSKATDKPEVDFKRWYVFRGGSNWGQVQLEGTRLYGSRKVAVLAVHWTQSVEVPTADEIAKMAAAPADIASINSELANGPIRRFSDSSGKALEIKDGTIYVQGYPPLIPITYRVEVTHKLAAPWGHLLQLVSGIATGGPQKLRNRTATIWSGRLMDLRYVPSDVVVRLLYDQALTEMDNQKFDDEGNYHFDISAGMPLRSINQLKYDTTGGAATPKTVTKYNLYGMLNYFFKAVDVKTNYSVWPPSILVGVGLTGRPWENPMLGLSFGTGKLSGFIGGAWSRVQTPGGVAAGGATTLNKQWDPHPKLVFGINLTARQVADLLKPKQ
jgi:hypothetical protein